MGQVIFLPKRRTPPRQRDVRYDLCACGSRKSRGRKRCRACWRATIKRQYVERGYRLCPNCGGRMKPESMFCGECTFLRKAPGRGPRQVEPRLPMYFWLWGREWKI